MKILLGETILPNFSVQIFTVPKILRIKECKYADTEFTDQNALIQDWLMQMC